MRPELISLSEMVDRGLLNNSEESIMHIKAYSGIGTGELTYEEALNLHRKADESRKRRRSEYLESKGISSKPTKIESALLKGVSWLEKLVK